MNSEQTVAPRPLTNPNMTNQGHSYGQFSQMRPYQMGSKPYPPSMAPRTFIPPTAVGNNFPGGYPNSDTRTPGSTLNQLLQNPNEQPTRQFAPGSWPQHQAMNYQHANQVIVRPQTRGYPVSIPGYPGPQQPYSGPGFSPSAQVPPARQSPPTPQPSPTPPATASAKVSSPQQLSPVSQGSSPQPPAPTNTTSAPTWNPAISGQETNSSAPTNNGNNSNSSTEVSGGGSSSPRPSSRSSMSPAVGSPNIPAVPSRPPSGQSDGGTPQQQPANHPSGPTMATTQVYHPPQGPGPGPQQSPYPGPNKGSPHPQPYQPYHQNFPRPPMGATGYPGYPSVNNQASPGQQPYDGRIGNHLPPGYPHPYQQYQPGWGSQPGGKAPPAQRTPPSFLRQHIQAKMGYINSSQQNMSQSQLPPQSQVPPQSQSSPQSGTPAQIPSLQISSPSPMPPQSQIPPQTQHSPMPNQNQVSSFNGPSAGPPPPSLPNNQETPRPSSTPTPPHTPARPQQASTPTPQGQTSQPPTPQPPHTPQPPTPQDNHQATDTNSDAGSIITVGPDGNQIHDDASQQSTISNASQASGEERASTPRKEAMGMNQAGRWSHPPTPQHPIPSPAASVNSMPDDSMDGMGSPGWTRMPSSPAANQDASGPPTYPRMVDPSYAHRADNGEVYNCQVGTQDPYRPKKPDSLSRLYELDDSPDRRAWLDGLLSFMERTNNPITACPTISKNPLDLYRLYLLVKEHGGFMEVTKAKTWKDIAGQLGIGASSSAAYTLRKHYMKNLISYECHFDRGGIDPQPLIKEVEATSKKKTKSGGNSVDGYPGYNYPNSTNEQFPVTASQNSQNPNYPGYPGYPPQSQSSEHYPGQQYPPYSQNRAYQAPYGQQGPGSTPGQEMYQRYAGPGQAPRPPYPPQQPPTSQPDQQYSTVNRSGSQLANRLTAPTTPLRSTLQATLQGYGPQQSGNQNSSVPRPQGYPPQRQPYPGYPQQPYPGWQGGGQYGSGNHYGGSPSHPHWGSPSAQQQYPPQPYQGQPGWGGGGTGMRPPFMNRPPFRDKSPYPMPQPPQKVGGPQVMPGGPLMNQVGRKELVFPPDSVEAVSPVMSKRRRLLSRDLPQVAPYRILLALKSGLLAECTWALDLISILLWDDSTVIYFSLQWLPGLIECLLEHYRRTLSSVFHICDDLELSAKPLPFTGLDNPVDEDSPRQWYETRKIGVKKPATIDEGCTDEDKQEDLGQVRDVDLEDKQRVIRGANFTMITREGKAVKTDSCSDVLVMDGERVWDSDGFDSGHNVWQLGGGDSTAHVIPGFERDLKLVPFVRILEEDDTRSTGCKNEDESRPTSCKNEDESRPTSCKNEDDDATETKCDKPKLEKQLYPHKNCDLKRVGMSIDDMLDNTRKEDEEVAVKDECSDETKSSADCDTPDMYENEQGELVVQGLIVRDPARKLKRKSMEEYEDESYCRDEPSLTLVSDPNDSLVRRCICVSNIFRSLSFIPGNDSEMSKNPSLLIILGKLLLLHHDHPLRSENRRSNYDGDEGPSSEACASLDGADEWWWEFLTTVRENTLVTLANISSALDLSGYSESISRPLLDGLLHWAVCPSATAQDPLNPNGSSLSPRRLALESLCKLCVVEGNVDLLLATPPESRINFLCSQLTTMVSRHEDQVLREFAVNLLHYIAGADASAARTIATQSQAISLLLGFVEQAEQTALSIANSHGVNILRDNPDVMGTSLDMLRRAAGTLVHLAAVPENRPLFLQHEARLLNLVMSQILDQHVASLVASVLFQVSGQAEVCKPS